MKKEELHKIAPTLAALKTKPEGFKIPINGIENLEVEVLSSILEKRLRQKLGFNNPFIVPENYFNEVEVSVSDKLSLINKTTYNLKVPENYFEYIESNVLKKLQENETETRTKVILFRRNVFKLASSIAVAASLALLFIFNPFSKSENISFDSLALSDIESWIENDRLELDAYQIAAVYKEVELTPKIISTKIDETELESFLKNQDIEALLYEE